MITTRADLFKNVISVVWLGLMAATLASWWLGVEQAIESVTTSSVLILVIAFAKVRFVGLYFMELRHAPVPLQLLFEGWCWVVCTTLSVMYLASA